MQNAVIRRAEAQDIEILKTLAEALRRGGKEPGYFERQLDYQQEGGRDVLIARLGPEDVAYAILNWQPKYGFFRKLGIPEIQDLNVLPAFRRRGIATHMIDYCEQEARARKMIHIGISFGLDPSYGAAQRLYIKLGYQPDGYGATYDRQTVVHGEVRPVDDNLCLMLVKTL